jgi:DNA-binding protein HU-beta
MCCFVPGDGLSRDDTEGHRLKTLGFKKEKSNMAKAMTKTQIIAKVAEKVGLTKKQTGEVVSAVVELAYKEAKNGFTLPGLGKLVVVQRKARTGRNPATGATIKIPAKKVLKFRIAKAAKEAITPTKK